MIQINIEKKIMFGEDAESSTIMCSWTAVEVINWFVRQGSSVYACLLDYRKAFDLVNHVKMFKNLMGRGVSLVLIRLMIVMYIIQRYYIRWEASRSYSFGVTNGVRQGSVFSPRGGFATYLDPMIKALRNSGYGCIIKGFWYGGLFFADDGILLSTSIQGLQGMISICEEHAKLTDLEFSTDPDPEKSKNCLHAISWWPSPKEPNKISPQWRSCSL